MKVIEVMFVVIGDAEMMGSAGAPMNWMRLGDCDVMGDPAVSPVTRSRAGDPWLSTIKHGWGYE